MPLLLAEPGYADRFRQQHPVVLNTTRVPPRPAPAVTPGCRCRLRWCRASAVGWSCRSGDVDAVVRAVLGLAADPQRARRMGAAGHAAVAAEFVAALEHAALQRPTTAGLV
jgi:hypothetical protein